MLPHRPRVAGRAAGGLFVVYLFNLYRREKFGVSLADTDVLSPKKFFDFFFEFSAFIFASLNFSYILFTTVEESVGIRHFTC